MQEYRYLPTLPSLLTSPSRPVIHRDLSWLQFNERVLEEAREASGNPLLERLKFLAISYSNLEEFFMIRLASLHRTLRSPARIKNNPEEIQRLEWIRDAILENVAKFGARQLEVFDQLTSELDGTGVHVIKHARESENGMAFGKLVFEKQVFPKLSPPETYELNKLSSLPNLKVAVIFPGGLWFLIPRATPFIYSYRDEVTGDIYYFFLDDLLETFLGPTFGLKGEPGVIRVTRDADFSIDIEEEDPIAVPDIVLSGLGAREKGNPVRLQYRGNLGAEALSQMATCLKLSGAQIFPAPGTFFLQGLWTVVKEMPEGIAAQAGLKYPALPVRVPKAFQTGESIFEKVSRNDYLLHHPYDSFDAFISWVKAAAQDPDVLMIEQTIYRMDTLSPLIDALKSAAAAGKRVRVVIELRARFDEANNLRLADDLRKAGVEVYYGFGKLKLHAKITLVTRREGEGANQIEKRYTHLSTGNYNATTARQYTDLAILTAHADIGSDARVFFDSVCEGKIPTGFKRLLSAPMRMHRKMLQLIEGETLAATQGQKTHIVAKVNALVDEEVIDRLYRASQAGVQVDLIVRGACSLIPGVKGLSENIRVISVVDRFLEHSRIYYFESAKAMYLSSADWMPRNFFSRLEIAFPVLDPRLYTHIERVILPTYLSDNLKARELTQQGTWKRRIHRFGASKIRSQFVFENLAAGEYGGTPLH